MRCFATVPNVVFAIPFCRRTLLLGALSVTLAACACPTLPQVATDGCASPGCLRRTAAVEAPLGVEPAPPRPAKTKSATVAAKPEKPLSPQTPAPEEKARSSKTMTLLSAPSDQPATVNKAKATIAAQMENATDVEFVDANRAIRKNTLGQPIDTICGHVKGKKPSGEEIGARQFLYLVKEDEAYVVDDNPESVPTTTYYNICVTSPRIGSPEWEKEQAESERREQRLKSIINGICRGC